MYASVFPKTETSIGWAYLHMSDETLDESDVNSALGWNVSFAGNLSPWLGVVADATGNYKTELLDLPEVDGMWHTFVGGPRFSLRMSPTVRGPVFSDHYERESAAVASTLCANSLGLWPLRDR
jgi:hypothetical protein